MHVRLYQERDLDAIVALDSTCFYDNWSKKNWKDTLAVKQYRCFIAEEEVPRGFLLVSTAADEGEILKIGVERSCRGKSFGMKLLTQAFRHWNLEGVKTVYLEVRASNDSALHLYEKAGFQNIGRRKNYYDQPKEDEVIYSLNLKTLEQIFADRR